MIKILIIEDDKLIRRYLEIELSKSEYKVEMAVDGEVGIFKAKNNVYDLILLDLMLPKISGDKVCQEIRKISTTPIIIISSVGGTTSKVSLLDIGANDYITKPFSIEELLARMRVLLRDSSKKTNILIYENFRVDTEQSIIYLNNEPLNLTRTEYKLLEYFIINREIILNREQIINNVWGYDYMGEEQIVDAYIKILRKKFDKNYIKTIRGFGYQLKKN
ncbi:MAG: response regulator transcription factor [Fusobacteriaceae bacterium]